ncbi:hypothetical protein D3C71_918710 [compost metagenome]
MAFNLHFAEHNFQRADEVRNAVGQRQVDQFDPWRYRQARIADHYFVAMTKRGDQSRQCNVEQRGLFHAVLNACTSQREGIDGCAPARVTDSAAAT